MSLLGSPSRGAVSAATIMCSPPKGEDRVKRSASKPAYLPALRNTGQLDCRDDDNNDVGKDEEEDEEELTASLGGAGGGGGGCASVGGVDPPTSGGGLVPARCSKNLWQRGCRAALLWW